MRTETVPRSEVELVIPADSLLKLPAQASYSGKSGQASVEVSRAEDMVVVYASCDSLRLLVEYYEGRSAHYKRAFEEADAKFEAELKQRSNPVRTYFYGFGTGVLASILTTIFILKQKQYGK